MTRPQRAPVPSGAQHPAYTRTDVVAMLGLVALSLTIFAPHVLGQSTFIGNADRLHIFLNVRELQVDAWQHIGRVPAWSDSMPIGVPLGGLHWMAPLFDPIAALVAIFPAERIFRISGYITVAHVTAGGLAAYLFLRTVVRSPFAAAVGAGLYVCSGFLAHGITQIDSIFAVLIFHPLGLLLLRTVRAGRLALTCLGLTTVIAGLVGFTFIQEVAYILMFFGLYAAYQLVAVRDWRPSLVLGVASLSGLLLAAPRWVTVLTDLREVSRSSSMQVTCACEILRWFDDRIFGQHQQEALAFGNAISLQEGLQLYTSTFAALGVIAMLLRPRGGPAVLAGFGFLLTLTLLAMPVVGDDRVALGLLGVSVALMGWALARPALGRRGGMATSTFIRDRDLRFALFFLMIAFGVVLSNGMRYAMYLLFFRVDFTHSRVAIAALLPLCMLAAVFVQELDGETEEAPGRPPWQRPAALAAGAALAAVATILLGPLGRLVTDAWFGGVDRVPLEPYAVSTDALGRVLATSAIFLAILATNWLARHVQLAPFHGRLRPRWLTRSPMRPVAWTRLVPVYLLGCLMVFQAFSDLYFQLNGDHTRTYPFPFDGGNNFTAPINLPRPPSPAARQVLRDHLETETFRSIIVLAPDGYPTYATEAEPGYSSFVGALWQLRLVNGYPVLNRRLAALPWPDTMRTLRSISFSDAATLPWPLLGTLNVKYAVIASPALLFNVSADPSRPTAEAQPDDLTILENPLPVAPRAFFVDAIEPRRPEPGVPIVPADPRRLSVVDNLDGPRQFGPSADVPRVEYHEDRLVIALTPSESHRFLVINELHHPSWHAYANDAGSRTELKVWPTNIVMRGVLVPPGVGEIEMRFEPFMQSWPALLLVLAGLLLGAGGWLAQRRLDRAQGRTDRA